MLAIFWGLTAMGLLSMLDADDWLETLDAFFVDDGV
jgi:hypothetical protein